MAMHHPIFFILSIIFPFLFLSCNALNQELTILLNLKHQWRNPPSLAHWNSSSVYCSWPELSCSSSGKVTRLTLPNHNITTSIPTSICQLRNLQFLNLSNNRIPGIIPTSLHECSDLTVLDLFNNTLVGEIPDTIGDLAGLEYLDLSINELSGKLPPSLFTLKNLTFLYLHHNRFSGHIPSLIESMNLIDIELGMNNLSGPIPLQFGQLQRLTYLSMFMNKISGEIPETIGQLRNLTRLKLFSNELSGPVPPDFGRYSPLQTFEIADNRLTGKLPKFLCSSGQLLGVIAFKNELTGELPETLERCDSLKVVMVNGNRLSGTIQSGVWMAKNLMNMMISENLFTGEIPAKVGRNLTRIEMSNNKFSGKIPASFPSQNSLVIFEASNNFLMGSIPKELTALSSLVSLLLDGNKLSGKFPPDIISWKSLSMLNLSRNKLSGEIPIAIGNLSHLGYFDLSNNKLSGRIPAILEVLNLQELNLSSNDLSGEIPRKLQTFAKLGSFVSNPNLCSSDQIILSVKPCSVRSDHRNSDRPSLHFIATTFGIAASVFTLTFAVSVFMIRLIHCRRKLSPECKWKLTSFHRRLSFTEEDILSNLTENNVIGGGGSGKVYIAPVNNSEVVAVKKIWSDSGLDKNLEKQFIAEAEILSTIRHSNIVKLLCCVHGRDSKLLVYEYMENRSLEMWLHHGRSRTELEWSKRLHIAIGAAQGLYYMHKYCSPPIIHRDVKPSNILLDSDFNAKIADFGLAKILKKQGQGEFNHSTTAVQGSFGYMAPEYAHSTKVNEKIDVYSFGVVLLELATGREPGGENGSLVDYATNHIQQCKPICDALDMEIREGSNLHAMTTVFQLGLLCTRATPSARPSMEEVLKALQRARHEKGFKFQIARSEYEGAPLLKSTDPL